MPVMTRTKELHPCLHLFLLCLVAINAVSGQDCGDGWNRYGDKCYQAKTGSYTWSGARKYCQKESGDLAIISTPDLTNFIVAWLPGVTNNYWVGLHDISGEGNFMWLDGQSTTDYGYDNWATGEPDNVGDTEDCVFVIPNTGEWTDDDCTLQKRLLCERDIGVAASSCDTYNGWLSFGNKCYFYRDTTASWANAEIYCTGTGGHIVSIESQEEADFIADYQLSYQYTHWLGFTDKDAAAAGSFTWSDDTLATSYVNWAPGQPDLSNYANGGNCARVTASNSPQWDTQACTGSGRRYICEKPAASCPDGWRIFQGNCYQFNTNNPKTWTDARHYCEAQSAYITTIITDADNQFLVSQFAELYEDGIFDIYIGISDELTDGTFKWTQGSSVPYTNWNDDMPFDYPDQADCGSMYTNDFSGKWDTTTCFKLQPFICKIQAGRPITSIPPDITTGRCEPGWQLFGDYCYHFSTSKLTWQGSSDTCVGMGSHLASIHNAEQQSFMSSRLDVSKTSTWIGFQSIISAGNWVWSDQTPVDFTNWARAEPGGTTTGACCRLKNDISQFAEWNDDNCNTANYNYVCQKEKIDDGTINTPSVSPSIAHDLHCGYGWDYNPDSGLCYAFRLGDYRSWSDARYQCRIEGGDLTSIGGFEEEAYIMDRTQNAIQSNGWIGGNDMSNEAGWEWTDGTGFRYINWNAGEPNNWGEQGEHCVEILFGNGKWNDMDCESTFSYICKRSEYLSTYFYAYTESKLLGYDIQILTDMWPWECAMQCVNSFAYTCRSFDYDREKRICHMSTNTALEVGGLTPTQDTSPFDYYERDMSVTTAAPPTPVPSTYGCETGWKYYNGYCYKGNIWYDTFGNSQTQCQQMGANLVSMRDMNENSFVTAYIREDFPGYDQWWIGLSDQAQEMFYTWIDGTDVKYTAWNYYEPNNVGEEDCGELYIPTGRWNDIGCDSWFFPAICKKPAMDIGQETVDEGCPMGWTGYESSCYKVEDGISASWDAAQQQCVATGGHLAIINDMYEQMYLSAQLGVLENDFTRYWIGLSQNDGGVYEWADGTTDITVTNWGEGQPDSINGKCVAVNIGSPAAGYWYTESCNVYKSYICEKLRYGFTTVKPPAPVPTTYPNNFGCSPGWIGFGGSCFQANEMVNADLRLSWDDARAYCLEQGGDLASYHGPGEEGYLTDTYIPMDPNDNSGYWIGLNDLAVEGGYVWTDNSPLDYTNWYTGEPNDYGGTEECAEGFLHSARGWNDDVCSKQKNWICKIPKGRIPITPSPPPPAGAPCPSDPTWVYRAPYCYYNSDPTGDGRLSFDEAEDFCHEGGGHLASIHDQGEQTFINGLLRNYLVGEYWLGLKDRNLGSGVYEWSDGTPYDFTAWKPGQPNYYNGAEGCVATEVETTDGGNWKDMACGIRQTFICKKDYDNVAPITHEPTTPTPGGCPTDWLKLDNSCYHLEGGNDQNVWTDWQTARSMCSGLVSGATLATIHSQLAQSELTSYLYYIQSDVWIGLTDIGQEGKFHWIDGSTLDYTNWLPGQPDEQILLPGTGERSDCAVMTNDPDHPGRWNDISCDDTHAFMCEASPNILYPDIPIPREVCIRSSYYKFGQDCYKVEPTLMTFANAKLYCENEGTVLATIADGYQEAYIETMVTKYGDKLWIGLVDDQSDGRFKWLDGWPLYYTDWANNEPSLRSGEACVLIKTNGRWDNVLCSELHYPVCKETFASPPATEAPAAGICPDDWLSFGSSCYKFDVARDYASWIEADQDCQQTHGARLASIHSKQENEFIRANAYTSVGLRGIWIDMKRGTDDQFENTDGSPVDFVNWANNEPSGGVGGSVAQDCVELYPDSYGKWADEDCTKAGGYVCKIPKMIPSGPTTPVPTTAKCPTSPAWFYNYPYCYYVSAAFGDAIKSWRNAESWCNTNGGYLTSIHSEQEKNYIMSILLQLIPSFWIGLREETGQNDFEWSDGTYVDYTFWDQNQPDDYAGQEACVEMHPLTTAGEWNDLACGVEQAFICKKRWDSTSPIIPGTTIPPLQGGCPSGWYKLDNKCYKLYGGGGTMGVLTWDESQAACQVNPGGDLASIHYQGVQSLLTALLRDHPGVNVWIGLSDKSAFRKFYWSDGSNLDYSNWAAGQPDGPLRDPSGTNCVELTNDPDHPGKWDDTTCEFDRMYMCQMPVDPSETGENPTLPNTCTQSGYKSYGDGCYKLDEVPRTYDTARTMCENEGAFLASIGDGYDEAFVETVLLKNGYAAAWIGLRQNPDTQEFGWVDGWPLLYTNWAGSEPSSDSGEGCVTVTADATWDNINCGLKQVSVCKYSTVEKPTTPAPIDGVCPPNGWIPSGSYCYLFDVSEEASRFSWNEASLICKQDGGELVSIHTKAENEFVRAKAEQLQNKNGMWLGLTLDDGGANYIWSDGTPLDFVNWANNEPNGETGYDCVEMFPDRYGKWDDKECLLGSGYACKQPKQPSERTTRRVLTMPPGGATTQNGISQEPAKQSGGASAGLVVGVLLAVLFVVLAVSLGGFFLYQKRNKDKALADITLGSTSFANVLYESKTEALGVEMVDKTNAPGTEA